MIDAAFPWWERAPIGTTTCAHEALAEENIRLKARVFLLERTLAEAAGLCDQALAKIDRALGPDL